MAHSIDIVCLANSIKHGGRCVAGLRLDTGGWIRPVPGSEDTELHPRHYETNSGHDPDPLDLLRIVVDEHQPKYHQPENWRITEDSWQLLEEEPTKRALVVVNAAIERGSDIFGTKDRSIGNEHLKESNAISSLTLVLPEQVEFYRDEQYDRQRVNFEIEGTEYDLPVTDPEWCEKIQEQEYTHMPASAYVENGERLVFTISLGEPYEGECYKLVAGIFTMPSTKIIDY